MNKYKRIFSLQPFIYVVVILALIITTSTLLLHSKKSYVALGDSIAAGQGLPTDSDSSACYRTNESYPNLVAVRLNFQLDNQACSGASINDGILGSQLVNGATLPAQISQLQSIKPYVVTITIGANDVDWLWFIMQCYVSSCGTAQDNQLVADKLKVLQSNLQKLLTTLHQNSNAQVFVTGYYNTYPSTVNACSGKTVLNNTKLAWLQTKTQELNQTIRNEVVKQAGYYFVPVDFSGHELCTSDPWVQDLNDKAPFHPTIAGQSAIADSIIKAYQR